MLKMEKIEHHAVIKLFVKKSLTPIEMFNEKKNVLNDAGLSFTTVKRCLKSATTPEIIKK